MHHSFLFLSYIYIYNMKHKERGPIMTFAFKKCYKISIQFEFVSIKLRYRRTANFNQT